jgi:hypothetical protein
MSKVSNPTTDMIAPTTSSLRSGERPAHQPMETGSGGCGVRGADFPFEPGDLLFPEEGVTVLPLGFPADLEDAEGVLRGIRLLLLHKPLNLQDNEKIGPHFLLIVYAVIESIAQMVCFLLLLVPAVTGGFVVRIRVACRTR